MFRKVLIANRGEIACRIIRTLQRLAVASVAVYSDADRYSPHVRQADEAIAIGAAPAAESYLDQQALLEAARATGAEAIHPGYGFLSENAAFAEACAAAGIVFIGPDPDADPRLRSEAPARELAVGTGVPLLPGSALLADLEEAQREAARIGYPVMLKSTAGGGGIGMALVREPAAAGDGLRARRAPGAKEFQPGRRLSREVHRARAAHRGADFRRRRGPRRRARRARLLGAAAQPKGHRGDAGAGLAAKRARSTASMRRCGWPSGLLPLRRHGRVRLRHESGGILLSRGQHAAAGRARRDRGGHRHRSGRVDAAHGGGRAVRSHRRRHATARRSRCGSTPRIRRTTFVPRPACSRAPDSPPEARVDTWVEDGTEVTPYYDPHARQDHRARRRSRAAVAALRAALDRTELAGIETNLDYLRQFAASGAFAAGGMTTRALDAFRFAPRTIEVLSPARRPPYRIIRDAWAIWDVGVPPSGPMDRLSFRLANRAVGNPPSAAALEMTVSGPTLKFNARHGHLPHRRSDGRRRSTAQPSHSVRRSPSRPGRRSAVGAVDGRRLPRLSRRSRRHSTCRPTWAAARPSRSGKFGGHGGRALVPGDVLHCR